jgi:DNA-binding transcriptional regulator YiaG
MKTLNTLKQELLADAETHAAYDAMADEFAIVRELVAARARAGLSQSEVAQRMGTTQSAVARMESGKRLPSHAKRSQQAPQGSPGPPNSEPVCRHPLLTAATSTSSPRPRSESDFRAAASLTSMRQHRWRQQCQMRLKALQPQAWRAIPTPAARSI